MKMNKSVLQRGIIFILFFWKSTVCKAKVMESLDYLQSLLNNVLDIGKVEAGTLHLVHKPFDLVAMLVKKISIVETNAKEYGISFEGGAPMSTFHDSKCI